MSTNFPTGLDALVNPTSSDREDTLSHAGQHADANDAIEALEAKIGIDGSAVTTSHDYKLSGVTGSDKAATLAGTETITNKTINAANNTITNIGDSEMTTGIDAAKLADGSVSNAEFQHLNGVTSAIQTQIDTKAASAEVTLNTATDVSSKSWVIDEDAMGSDDATKVPTQQSVKAYVDATSSGIMVPTVRTYTAGATWTKPAGLQFLVVEVQAAGGAGGGSTDNGYGAGGSGGGYSKKTILAASLGATETVTVGAGGAGVLAATGANGGTSSFGSHLSATGGVGGADEGSQTTGGTGSGGDLNIPGGDGFRGGTDSVDNLGSGGSSMFGNGGLPSSSGNGDNATGYGAGGGGSLSIGSTAFTGGSGTDGIVIVTEYSI